MISLFEGRKKASQETGRTFCFQLRRIIVEPDSDRIMLNQYIHKLSRRTVADKDDIYVALTDLVNILSPEGFLQDRNSMVFNEMILSFKPDYRTVEIGEEIVILKKTPFETNSGLFIPIAEVMEKVFGQYVCRIGSYIAICEDKVQLNEPFDGPWTQALSPNRLKYRFHKQFGDRYYTIWMPKAKRLNVYRMYIPSTYDSERPWKLLLCLHGGNGNSDTPFIRSQQKLQYYAEQYRYILLAPNSYVHGSNYGGAIPPVHMFPEPEVKHSYPNFYSEEVLEENQIAEEYFIQVLNQVMEQFHIDKKRIFVMGNSMGSIGTFHALSTWPDIFRAGVPTAVMPLTEYLDIETLKQKPIYFMTGTEDANDPTDMLRRYEDLKAKGCPIQFYMIGGGYHADAWVSELERMFRFFESF